MFNTIFQHINIFLLKTSYVINDNGLYFEDKLMVRMSLYLMKLVMKFRSWSKDNSLFDEEALKLLRYRYHLHSAIHDFFECYPQEVILEYFKENTASIFLIKNQTKEMHVRCLEGDRRGTLVKYFNCYYDDVIMDHLNYNKHPLIKTSFIVYVMNNPRVIPSSKLLHMLYHHSPNEWTNKPRDEKIQSWYEYINPLSSRDSRMMIGEDAILLKDYIKLHPVWNNHASFILSELQDSKNS